MNIKNIFNEYYNGETNFITPEILEYRKIKYDNYTDILIEISRGDMFDKDIYGCTTLIYNKKTNEVQRINLSDCFCSIQDLKTYIDNDIKYEMKHAKIYGECKVIV